MKLQGEILCLILFISLTITLSCTENKQENGDECGEPSDTSSVCPADSASVLCLPYIDKNDITYIQPFGILLEFGENDWRPHAAVDFGCDDSVEFKASVSGTLGNIWLEYQHSYQFNIVVNDKYTVHYCLEPVNISSLSDDEKLDAIYFSPGDPLEKGQVICKMVGGGGHLDWGLLKEDERVCPACYLPDEEYESVNALFKNQQGSYEGYENLCPDNEYHTNPRP